MDVRIGCQANAWQREFRLQEHLPEALRQMAEAGFAGAELPVWSIPDLDQPPQIRDLLAAHRLDFIAIHIGGNFYDSAAFEAQTLPAVRRAAECAATAGAQALVISAAAKQAPLQTVPFEAAAALHIPPHASKSPAELHAQAANLAEAARIDQDLGLTTYYHNHYTEFDNDEAELRSILEIDPGLLSLCFDVGNAARALPDYGLPIVLERYWERIGYLHFKDIMGETLAEALGEGEIDFSPIAAMAKARGFQGWASAEIEPARGMVAERSVLEDARISYRFIRALLGD